MSGWSTYTTVTKVLLTVLLCVWFFLGPVMGYYPVADASGTVADGIFGHLLWPFSHANVWHLAGNLWVLWLLKGRLYVRESYVMSVLCSFLPVVPGLWEIVTAADASGTVATCGFSGVLCAMIGVKWGAWIRGCHGMTAYWTFAKRVLPFVALGFLIPHVNWSIHLYCLLVGLAYGRWE